MENLQDAKIVAANEMTLQEYADTYCGGNRYLAAYVMLYNSSAGNFDRHIDDVTPEEAAFVMHCLEDNAIKAYGGEKNYRTALKAAKLAGSLGMELDDVRPDTPNPATKKLLSLVIGMFATIVLLVIIGFITEPMDYLLEVAIGLFAMTIADSLLKFFRFRRIKRMLASLPSDEEIKAYEYCRPPFEELYAAFEQRMRKVPRIEKEEAEQLLSAAGKQVLYAFLWLLVYGVLAVVSLFVGYLTGPVGGIVCAVAMVAFFVWRMIVLFRSVAKARDVGNTKDVSEQQQKSMNTRQGLYALASILIGGAYLITAVVGSALAIGLSL